jgi:hypothetical protein
MGPLALSPSSHRWQDGLRRVSRGSAIETKAGEHYQRLTASVAALPATPTAVAHPCDSAALAGAVDAAKIDIITPILVGPLRKIANVAAAANVDIAHVFSGTTSMPLSVARSSYASSIERSGSVAFSCGSYL